MPMGAALPSAVGQTNMMEMWNMFTMFQKFQQMQQMSQAANLFVKPTMEETL